MELITNDKITNKDIIKFYSKKFIEDEEHYINTYSFATEQMQHNGGYIDTAKAFIHNGVQGKKDDQKFYKWLLKKKDNDTLYSLKSLKYLKENDDFVFLINKKVNQKWHCLISWYARLEHNGKLTEESYKNEIKISDETCMFKMSITCPELRLWLVEAAIDEKYITNEDVENFKKEAIKYSKDKINNKKSWNKIWSEYVIKILCVINSEFH